MEQCGRGRHGCGSLRTRGKQRGFVALLFVIVMAISLSAFVFSLTRSFSYTLILLDQYRARDNARSAALYCYHRLSQAYELDIGYMPRAGDDDPLPGPRGTFCRYLSFVALPDARGFDVQIEGISPTRKAGHGSPGNLKGIGDATVFKIDKKFRKNL